MLDSLLTRENIASFIRHVLTTAGGGLLASGAIDSDTFNAIVGGVVAAVGFVWSYFKNRKVTVQ